MNTNAHEWKQVAKNKRVIRIERKIRVHSCSFVAEFLFISEEFNMSRCDALKE